MTDRIAAIGNADFLKPFAALGVDVFPAEASKERATEAAQKVIEQKYTFVIIQEDIAPAVEEVFGPTQKKTLPCVTVVPFTAESTGFAAEALGHALKMATGVNILEED